MQTFLPHKDFEQSAKILDNKRLGKQRVEVLQILKALLDPKVKGWVSHPATKMWKGHEFALCEYGIEVCREWRRRGFKDTCLEKTMNVLMTLPTPSLKENVNPQWLGDERVHSSHRANLLRKDPEYYGKFGWTESPAEGYYWGENETS